MWQSSVRRELWTLCTPCLPWYAMIKCSRQYQNDIMTFQTDFSFFTKKTFQHQRFCYSYYSLFADIFHWSCFDAYERALPANTAPAGYLCPVCSACIFPPPNSSSPVIEALCSLLATVNWARAGLGLPMVCGACLLSHVLKAKDILICQKNSDYTAVASLFSLVILKSD